MKQKGFSPIIILVLVIAAAIIGFLVYQNTQLRKQTIVPSPTPTVSATVTSVATPSPSPSLKPGWKTYTNTQYGFEINFPDDFRALSDSANLYGWPNAVVLIYNGGQSYDLPIEVWSSEAAYKANYPGASNITVFKTNDGKFITLTNMNNDPQVSEIIATFKFTQ